jgi:hypothetical protein
LGDVDPELQQLAMNAWRTPERVVAAHRPDQSADVGRDRRPADTTTRLPAPVQTEATSVPAHQGLGLKDDRGSEQGREQPVEPDENQPIYCPQPEPGWRRPLEHEQLLAEKCHLGFAGRLRSEQAGEESAEQLQEIEHPEMKVMHRWICATPDEIFGRRIAWTIERIALVTAEG